MVNQIEVIAQIVGLSIVTADYYLDDNSGVTEMLKNYTTGKIEIEITSIIVVKLPIIFCTL